MVFLRTHDLRDRTQAESYSTSAKYLDTVVLFSGPPAPSRAQHSGSHLERDSNLRTVPSWGWVAADAMFRHKLYLLVHVECFFNRVYQAVSRHGLPSFTSFYDNSTWMTVAADLWPRTMVTVMNIGVAYACVLDYDGHTVRGLNVGNWPLLEGDRANTRIDERRDSTGCPVKGGWGHLYQ